MKTFIKGQKVIKKSFKPFKNGLKVQTIEDFGLNTNNNINKPCAIFDDKSICNLENLLLANNLVIINFKNINYISKPSSYDNIYTDKLYLIQNQSDLLRIIGKNDIYMKVMYAYSKNKEYFDIVINKTIPLYEVVKVIRHNDELKNLNLPTISF